MPARTLDDTNFIPTITSSQIPVIVDFTAGWCQPCKALSPLIDALAGELAGKAIVAKVDIGVATRASVHARIQAVPTIVVYRGGREVQRLSGVQPLAVLRALV